MKRCSKCGEEKEQSKFSKHSREKDGLSCWCKACCKEFDKKYYASNSEKIKSRSSKWAKDNPEKANESTRKWAHANPEKVKEKNKNWQPKNTEKMRAADRRYKESHHGIISDRKRRAYAKNPEKFKESARKSNNIRRALKLGSGGVITEKEWLWLKEFYGYTCLCCGRCEPEIKLTLDHVIPLIVGGKNSIDNAQPLCRSCNSKKHVKTMDYRKPRELITP